MAWYWVALIIIVTLAVAVLIFIGLINSWLKTGIKGIFKVFGR